MIIFLSTPNSYHVASQFLSKTKKEFLFMEVIRSTKKQLGKVGIENKNCNNWFGLC